MKIHEYQAKDLLRNYGIPVPPGSPTASPTEARKIASDIGCPVVIKAQVHAGGRGKGGGIKTANNPDEVERQTAQLLAHPLVTHQTGPEGRKVSKVLVERFTEIKQELYLGITVDSSSRLPVIIASSRGGMDIEEIARATPMEIIKGYLEPDLTVPSFIIKKLSYGMKLEPDQHAATGDIISRLFRVFIEKDCSMAEINPLVLTSHGSLLALDAKLVFDDNALFRHADIASLSDPEQETALEKQASELGVKNYVKLDGNIGCLVNGAGLAMAVLDMISYTGGKAANFLDIGTLNNSDRVVNAFRILDKDESVKSVLVNIFGGMARADIIAKGLVEASMAGLVKKPVVVRLAGTNVEEGKKILAESGLPFIIAADMQEAAIKARELAV